MGHRQKFVNNNGIWFIFSNNGAYKIIKNTYENLKKLPSVDKDLELIEIPYIAGGNAECYSHFRHSLGIF